MEVRRGRAWIPAALCAVLAASAAAAWLVLPAEGSPFADDADSAPPTSSGPNASAGPEATTTWEPTTPDPDISVPGEDAAGSTDVIAVSVTIPSIDVDSPLVPLGTDPSSGVLVPPQRYDTAGVFAAGPVPGAVGPAIIAGHVDSQAGAGVFYRLEELTVGASVSVSLSDGQRVEFRVVETAQYPKTAFPTEEVYGPTPGPELRLITCGGSFDPARRSYRDNIVVYAVRA